MLHLHGILVLACLLLKTAQQTTPSGQNLADSAGNPQGFWLLVEGIHVEIWVVSETRIHVEIQGKFSNWR